MKYTFFLLCLTLTLSGFAQEYKQKWDGKQLIKIQYHRAQLRIEGHKGSELILQAKNYVAPPERAKGLRSLYNTAVDNTGIGMAVETKDGVLQLREASQDPGGICD